MIEAVLFDWGHTLTLTREYDLLQLWHATAAVLEPEAPAPLAAELLAAEDTWWRTRVRDGGGVGSGTTADLLAVVRPGADVAALDAYHAAWGEHIVHDDAAAEVLHGCRDRGWRTGLLSNTHWPAALHDRWLEEAGLRDLLDVRLYTSDLTHMKPHAEAFGELLRALDVRAERAVFVGDRPHDDISGAQAVGMRTVLMRGRPVPAHDVVPDAEIARLSELLDVLDSW